jgi:hypothetical protein
MAAGTLTNIEEKSIEDTEKKTFNQMSSFAESQKDRSHTPSFKDMNNMRIGSATPKKLQSS